MDRVKTLLKYAIWVLVFFILSEFLINVGLNSTYRKISRKDNIEQVNIYQAEATLVNGRIRGTITNSEPEELNGKYVRIDFYSKRDVFLGRRYIEVKDLAQNGTMSFEVFFKLKEVGSYEVVIADKKELADEIEWVPKDWTKGEIIAATIVTLLIAM